jgi:diaminohydroxyphosphoribosylaminopyrimidine deaminase/5-amino-6-(5-phosphoribosylamino)uracil reductase
MNQPRPYVTLKWAQTADGRVAGPGGERLQISTAASRELVHELRSRVGGILVGVNTVLADDPLLNARYARGPRDPARFILDRDLRTPLDAQLVKDRSASTNIFCSRSTDGGFRHRRDALQEAGVNTTIVATDAEGRIRLADVLERIKGMFCNELLVESGPTLAASCFRDNLADRLWIFRSPKVVDDPTAPSAAAIPPHFLETARLNLDGDTLTEYLNPQSPVFFAPTPSADFELARQTPV